MQSFLLPLSGGNPTATPAPTRVGKADGNPAGALLPDALPTEFGDIFAADALAIAAEEESKQVAAPLGEEDIEVPEFTAADAESDEDNIRNPKDAVTDETTLPPPQNLPLESTRSKQMTAEMRDLPDQPAANENRTVSSDAPLSDDNSGAVFKSSTASSQLQIVGAFKTSAAKDVKVKSERQTAAAPTVPTQTQITAEGRFAPVTAQPAQPAHIVAAIAERQEAAPPLPAAPRQSSAAKSVSAQAAQVAPLTITALPASAPRDTFEKVANAALEPFTLGRSDSLATLQSTTTAVTPRADLASHVARQIADVAHHMPARPVEITLSPEELGRVRLSITTHDSGIVLNIVAERPETMDLLRRHIGQLGEQFQSLGYENIAFSFSGGGDTQTSDDQGAGAKPDGPLMNETDVEPLQIALATGTSAGVDLRL